MLMEVFTQEYNSYFANINTKCLLNIKLRGCVLVDSSKYIIYEKSYKIQKGLPNCLINTILDEATKLIKCYNPKQGLNHEVIF